jgi:hypothetical protein
MIDCAAMRDRMPDAARGAVSWTEAEVAHLASCADCALEGHIVGAGIALEAGTVVAADRIAATVMARLRAVPTARSVIRCLPWRGGVIGLLAAAASVALIVSAPRLQRPLSGSAGETAMALAVLPELQALDESQLESVLQSLGPTAADATPGLLPHLEDLTDSELERLLHEQRGN